MAGWKATYHSKKFVIALRASMKCAQTVTIRTHDFVHFASKATKAKLTVLRVTILGTSVAYSSKGNP